MYNETKCLKALGRGRLGLKLFARRELQENGAFIVFGCVNVCVVIFLPFCRRFSHFKRLTDMSVKVNDVLVALQQMQKSLECSIWYERTVASICFNTYAFLHQFKLILHVRLVCHVMLFVSR